MPNKNLCPFRTIANRGRIAFFVLSFFGFFLEACFGQTAEPEPYILSQRIGLEIDSVEAEYFNIFPGLDGVKSAVYRQDNLGNLRILVSLATGKDTALTFSKLAAEQLRYYIDNHEVLVDRSDLVNWDLLPGYNLNRINYFENHGNMVFVETDSTTLYGCLMLVTDSSVLLWNAPQPFQPRNWQMFTKKILVKDINQIESCQDLTGRLFGITLGAGLGAALVNVGYNGDFGAVSNFGGDILALVVGGGIVGAGLGYLFDISTLSRRRFNIHKNQELFLSKRRKLERRAMFHLIYPPELRDI